MDTLLPLLEEHEGGSVWRILPYTAHDLKRHLEKLWEPWMNWGNYGVCMPHRQTWQIDHIIPQSNFKYTSVKDKEFLECWALSNLRPLEAAINIQKGNKLLV